MKQERMETYERSLDAAMVVAIGKLLLYSSMWENLKTKLSRRTLNARQTEMLRRQLKQIINDLGDELFFLNPDQATSEEEVKKVIISRIKTHKLTDTVMRQLKSRLKAGQSDLGEYF